MIVVKENVSLKEYTTFNIGGDARYFMTIQSLEDLRDALHFAKKHAIPYVILAGGSNVLIADEGFDGLVIHMKNDIITMDGSDITIGAGAELMDLILFAARKGLGGMENMTGIPGSIGGAVRGNAAAFGTETKDLLRSVEVLDTKTDEIMTFDVKKCHFSYRSSVFKSERTYIVVNATFSFVPGKEREIEQKMYDILSKRNAKHIQNIQSAGSFFINPKVNKELQENFHKEKGVKSRNGRVPAGWLLDLAGVYKKKVGGIQAGETHANYFINDGTGTAEQAMQLAAVAKTRVRNEFGVQLQEEVTFIGF